MTVYVGMVDSGDRATAFSGADMIENTILWNDNLSSKTARIVEGFYDKLLPQTAKWLWEKFSVEMKSEDFNNIMWSISNLDGDVSTSYGGPTRISEIYNTLSIFGINPIDTDFANLEGIIRYLGYGALYDRPDTCLFTHQSLTGLSSEDIIEVPIWIPMLDVSEAPKARILKGIVSTRSWDCTHMGCDLEGNPHTSPLRPLEDPRRRMRCAITSMSFEEDAGWANTNSGDAGFPLIPVHPDIKQEIAIILMRKGTPRGVGAEEWSPSKLLPHMQRFRAT